MIHSLFSAKMKKMVAVEKNSVADRGVWGYIWGFLMRARSMVFVHA